MIPLFKLRPQILAGPNIPAPLHGLAPRVVLGSKWWNATRKETYRSTDYRCVACGIHKTVAKYRQWIEAHELYDVDYVRGRMTYVETVPLCHLCHSYVHDGRLRALLSQGKLHHGKFTLIIQHGDKVLTDAGVPLRLPYSLRDATFVTGIMDGTFAAWQEWRLVVFDKEYLPTSMSYSDWNTSKEMNQ